MWTIPQMNEKHSIFYHCIVRDEMDTTRWQLYTLGCIQQKGNTVLSNYASSFLKL